MHENLIKNFLIDRISPIFAKPKGADALARELAKHTPEWTSDEALISLSNRIIETRKVKSFPSASELVSAVKGIPDPRRATPTSKIKSDWRAEREHEERAERLIKSTTMGDESIAGGWAVGLVSFIRETAREPDEIEKSRLIKLVKSNDTVYDNPGALGEPLCELRRQMHKSAERELRCE